MPRTPRPWSVALALVRLVGLFVVIAASSGRAYAASASAGATSAPRFGPEPTWLAEAPVLDATNAKAARGQRLLFADREIRVDATGADEYRRVDREIVDTVGLQEATKVVVDFDPTYETVTIHSLAIVRDGQILDRLDRKAYKIVQRETNLEKQIYDGRLSLIFFVDDVRVGDVVRFAFTVREADPVLEGHYSGAFPLSLSDPVEHLRLRFLTPAPRHFANQVHAPPGTEALAPQVRPLFGYLESTWDRSHVAAAPEGEGKAPSWYVPFPLVEVSDFESWEWVSRWGARVFSIRESAPALHDWVENARKTSASKEDLLLAATRFVQDEIRYVGVEVGAGRLRPEAPADVLARRFGDCKGKAALLVALLRDAGIEARPALISTSLDERVEEWFPSPGLFDHVIVEAQLDGTPYWIDATESLQGGTLSRLRSSTFARALPLDAAGAQIVRLDPEPSREEIRDEVLPGLPPADTKAVLTSRREYRGPIADGMRRLFAKATPDQMNQILKAYYKDDYPSIILTSPVESADDRRNDTISITAHFEIPDFWTLYAAAGRYGGAWHPRGFERFVPVPSADRIAPLAMPYPLEVRQTILVTLAVGPCAERLDTRQAGPAFYFHYAHRCEGLVAWNVYDLLTEEAWIDASKIASYRAAVDAARGTEGGQLYFVADGFNTPVFCALLVTLAFIAVVAVLVARRARKASPPQSPPASRAMPDRLPAGAIVLGLFLVVLAGVGSVGAVRNLAVALSRRHWTDLTSTGPQAPAFLDVAAIFVKVVACVATPFFLWFATILLARRRPSFRWPFTIGLAGDLGLIAVVTWDEKDKVLEKLFASLPPEQLPALKRVQWVPFAFDFLFYGGLAACALLYVWRSKRLARALGIATADSQVPAAPTIAALTESSPEASPRPPDPACIAESASPPSCRPES